MAGKTGVESGDQKLPEVIVRACSADHLSARVPWPALLAIISLVSVNTAMLFFMAARTADLSDALMHSALEMRARVARLEDDIDQLPTKEDLEKEINNGRRDGGLLKRTLPIE